MAKAYRTKRDVSFPRVLSTTGNKEGGDYFEATEGINYAAGGVVPHDSLPSFVKDQIEQGGFDHLLEPIEDDEEAASELEGVQDGEYGVFVPEHEAEAHALYAAGKGVVPKEQAMELGAETEEYHRQYQQAAKEHGLDHRPAQEFLAEAAQERVPEEILTGRETNAGLPYERHPEGFDDAEEGRQDESPGGDDRQAVRARPNLERNSETEGSEAENRSAAEGERGQEEAPQG